MYRGMIPLVLLLAAAAPQPPAASAQAFIESIYKPWVANLSVKGRSYSLPADAKLYTPELTALIAKDERRSRALNEVGVIDWVILCGCQDDSGMTTTITIVGETASKATAKVALAFNDKYARTLTLSLVKLKQGWRIADVSDGQNMLSVLALLQKELRGKR